MSQHRYEVKEHYVSFETDGLVIIFQDGKRLNLSSNERHESIGRNIKNIAAKYRMRWEEQKFGAAWLREYDRAYAAVARG